MIEKYALPGSIVLAGAFIGLGIFLSGGIHITSSADLAAATQEKAAKDVSFRAVSADEHIMGSADAPVKIIEYSDLECPFCKAFHPTLEQVVQEYNGQVAWVYRHFPIQSHANAMPAAIASECVAQLAGNEAFWNYITGVFVGAPASLQGLDTLAAQNGVDKAAFTECTKEAAVADAINADYQDALASGGTGTPHSLIVSANGTIFPLMGNQPIGALRVLIDEALKEN